jgi:primosomal protein N' (replication factor Y)
MLLADVAVPVPLARPFTYSVPEKLASRVVPGSRVVCAFGKSRRLIGVVLRVEDREPPPGVKIKPLATLIDERPVVPEELLTFLLELASYYLSPIGEVLRLALPALERDRERELEAQGDLLATDTTKKVGGRRVAFAKPTDAIEPPGKLRGQASMILALLRSNGEVQVARLADQFGGARKALEKLASLGLAVVEEREVARDPFFTERSERDLPPDLNDAQAGAATAIEAALSGSTGAAFLLFGVTGSGKTEVYLRAIAACLARGKGALMLVPEIALTPQLVSRFRARFGDDLAVLHSGLSENDRHAMWRRLREGEVRVAIGARSALFAPVPELGLLIVDEEHDGSFKQEEGVRYHARDMALLRAHRAKAVVVLGSATPSLEAIGLVERGKVIELSLPDRAVREASLPSIEIVNLRRIGAGPSGNKLVTLPLHRAIEATLLAKEQVILFLNRRGFAPSVVCESCGAVETCQACSVALTYHKARGGRVQCHYCDYDAPLPTTCSGCHAPALELEGLGTERLEATIMESFPNARVARLDRDVGDGKKAEAILERMRKGEIDVLVGTQMVTKGHDLPNVTLVGVVNADAALSLPDFRASERGFSLLVQVAGRAGRRDRPGRVIIQTRSPDHPAVKHAAKHDVRGFLRHELADRREVGYPPYSRLALIRLDAMDEDLVRREAQRLADLARTAIDVREKRVEILGPAAAPLARLRGRFRFRVVARSSDRAALRRVLLILVAARSDTDRLIRASIDVDPVGML